GDEGEAAVLIDGDDHRDDEPVLLLGGGVELLAEFHDVDAMLTQGGPHRGRRIGLTSRDLQLHHRVQFFCHDLDLLLSRISGPWPSAGLKASYSFSIWWNSNSTGVWRPKMVTMTLTLSRSGLISSTDPEKFAKGPSITFTKSPFSNWLLRARRSR